MIFKAQETANQWKEELKGKVDNFKTKPVMAVIVAKNYYPPSKTYINNKIKTNHELNAETRLYEIEWEGRDGLDDIEHTAKSDSHMKIEEFIDANPEAAAQLLRNWLGEDWRYQQVAGLDLSGIQKAAILLIALGPEKSSQIFNS